MNEQISALIDDELALDEVKHVLAALQTNNNAAHSWTQYHLIGDAMRGSITLHADIKYQVMQKIELEPTVLAPNAGLHKTADTPVNTKKALPTSWAMAASVAGVMAVGWMLWQTQAINPVAAEMQMAIAPVNTQMVAKAQAVQTEPAKLAQTQAEPMQVAALSPLESEQSFSEPAIPDEYLIAHQATAPTTSAYYIQATYSK